MAQREEGGSRNNAREARYCGGSRGKEQGKRTYETIPVEVKDRSNKGRNK
jgi:hypothetical protein